MQKGWLYTNPVGGVDNGKLMFTTVESEVPENSMFVMEVTRNKDTTVELVVADEDGIFSGISFE